jgi:hypothetical protein
VELLMPAKSAKQEKFMQAVANNPKFAKKVGVPQSVGKKYTKPSELSQKRKRLNARKRNT